MNKLCIVTATRAEYGIMKNLIQKFQSDSFFDVRLVVTGTHLSGEYGFTYQEIEQDDITIDDKIDILSGNDSYVGISETMANCMNQFARYFDRKRPDLLLILGDRYEILAVCIAAMVANIPIAHIHGGETTEGAIDEAIRHSITKMSYLHFTSTKEYRRRVIQLGENPERVFCVGALGVENALNENLFTQSELEQQLRFDFFKPYAVVTYHPETLGMVDSCEEVQQLLAVIKENNSMNFIITKSNADYGGHKINNILDEFGKRQDNVKVFASLGMKRYLSVLKYAKMVIGNSSSGIVEAPSFHIPTINIGERQRGRTQAKSVINCAPSFNAILNAMNEAQSIDFIASLQSIINPYSGNQTSEQIKIQIKKYLEMTTIDLKKRFYDLET